MKYKVLFTDLDDTVFDSSSLYSQAVEMSWEHLRKFYNIDRGEFVQTFTNIRNQLKEAYKHKNISHNRAILFERLLESFNIPFDAGLIYEMYETYWFCVNTFIQPFPTNLETLKTLKEHGVKIIGISDGTLIDRIRNINALKMSDLFTYIVSSEETIDTKPEPDMFELALEKAKCTKEEAIFIGDSWNADVLGGVNFGLNTVWFNPYDKEMPSDSHIKPNYTIKEFSQLIPIFELDN